jgi:hypothetical protein
MFITFESFFVVFLMRKGIEFVSNPIKIKEITQVVSTLYTYLELPTASWYLERERKKTAKDNSTQSNTGFEEWCNQLIQFKEDFGHCNVPQRFANNPSWGKWCSNMISAYNKNQKGMKSKYSTG